MASWRRVTTWAHQKLSSVSQAWGHSRPFPLEDLPTRLNLGPSAGQAQGLPLSCEHIRSCLPRIQTVGPSRGRSGRSGGLQLFGGSQGSGLSHHLVTMKAGSTSGGSIALLSGHCGAGIPSSTSPVKSSQIAGDVKETLESHSLLEKIILSYGPVI